MLTSLISYLLILFFFFNAPPTTEIYTLSLHDALPTCWSRSREPPGWCSLRASGSRWRWHCSPRPYCAADRKSTRLNSSHVEISYAVFCLKKKKNKNEKIRSLSHTNKEKLYNIHK